jgi:hypothetical protein
MGNKSGDRSLNPRLCGVEVVTWERPFDQPVPLPNSAPARTLRDAANYIKKLAASERETPECRLAIHMLIDAAEDRGPMLFAKVCIERAFYREAVRVPYPKSSDVGRRKMRRPFGRG